MKKILTSLFLCFAALSTTPLSAEDYSAKQEASLYEISNLLEAIRSDEIFSKFPPVAQITRVTRFSKRDDVKFYIVKFEKWKKKKFRDIDNCFYLAISGNRCVGSLTLEEKKPNEQQMEAFSNLDFVTSTK